MLVLGLMYKITVLKKPPVNPFYHIDRKTQAQEGQKHEQHARPAAGKPHAYPRQLPQNMQIDPGDAGRPADYKPEKAVDLHQYRRMARREDRQAAAVKKPAGHCPAGCTVTYPIISCKLWPSTENAINSGSEVIINPTTIVSE